MTDILLRFVHITDTHISADPDFDSPTYHPSAGARALVKAVNALPFKPDFVMHTGDVADATSYQLAREIFASLESPIYYVRGNTDEVEALQRTLMGRTEVKTPYFYYEFEVNGVQIVCLDSNGPVQPPAGYIDSEQLAWLEGICSAQDSRPLLVMLHHNLIKIGDVPLLDDWARVTNGDEVHKILLKARERLRGVFYGHIHQPLDNYRDGILYSVALSSWYQFYAWPGSDYAVTGIPMDNETPPGFSVVTISRESTTIRRHVFRVEA